MLLFKRHILSAGSICRHSNNGISVSALYGTDHNALYEMLLDERVQYQDRNRADDDKGVLHQVEQLLLLSQRSSCLRGRCRLRQCILIRYQDISQHQL